MLKQSVDAFQDNVEEMMLQGGYCQIFFIKNNAIELLKNLKIKNHNQGTKIPKAITLCGRSPIYNSPSLPKVMEIEEHLHKVTNQFQIQEKYILLNKKITLFPLELFD